jgi:hypothetical protein
MDFIDFYTALKEISYMLNSRPVELLISAYSKSGGAQETDSSLPDSWTGSLKSYYTESGPDDWRKLRIKSPSGIRPGWKLVRTNSSCEILDGWGGKSRRRYCLVSFRVEVMPTP